MPTPENAKKIKYLSRYIVLNRRVDRLLEEKAKWWSLCLKVTPSLSPAPGGGESGSPVERPMDKVLEIEEKIDQEIDELQEVRRDIKTVLGQLEDDTLRLLMEYRYIDGLTWEQVAVKMHYGFQWVCKLHGRALDKIDINKR